MRTIIKKNILVASVLGTLLIGCGTTDTALTETTDISVERGPVIGAYVVDNNGNKARNLGAGEYRFDSTPIYPVNVYGGYIDVNRDGVINNSDTKLTFALRVQQSSLKVTVVTTLIEDEEIKNELIDVYGLSEDELYTLTPSNSLEVLAISNEVFKYCIENSIDLSNVDIDIFRSLETDIKDTIANLQTLEDSIENIAISSETELIQDLNITLSDDDVTDANTVIDQSSQAHQDVSTVLDTLPVYELTTEQEDGLVFMYQEEKVARDVYLKLGELWGLRVFENIAKAEQKHMDAVKDILEKYELEIPVISDEIGVFDNNDLQLLYDQLLAQGSVSSNDALIVGKLVEETDIADLEERLIDAPEDISLVYNSLLNGSFNHLNAFSKQIQ